MPDITHKTVSATEVAALFGESPYLTKWMLYQNFVNGTPIATEENERMVWGRKMQPLIAEQAAQDHGFVVEQNEQDRYLSRGVLGCTRDAIMVNPSRGKGALETKACFDYRIWMDRWDGGKHVPREYELQLQAQIYVGDDGGPFEWGVIAAWVGAQQFYFFRDAQPILWATMESEASRFLFDVVNRKEPDPAGSVLELPLLAQLYPTITGKVLDWRDRDGAEKYVTIARTYLASKAAENSHGAVAKSIRAEFIGILKDHDTLLLPGGARVNYNGRISMWVPTEKK